MNQIGSRNVGFATVPNSPRASTHNVSNSHNMSSYPYKSHLRDAIFYEPRGEEILYENNLITNQKRFMHKQTIDKLKKKQLPDKLRNMLFETTSSKDKLFQQDSLGSINFIDQMNHHESYHVADKTQIRKDPYALFDQMLKEKYQLSDDKFMHMPRKDRNKMLVKMLEQHGNMIVFPNPKVGSIDGLPHLSFVFENLKDIIKEDGSKRTKKDKGVLKPRVDMGIPPPQPGEENQARAGATFDPKQFKGNVQLFQHLNEVSLSMLRQPIEASNSVRKKKMTKTSYGDDYGLTLLEEDIERNKVVESESSGDEELDRKIQTLAKIQSIFDPKREKLPQIEVKSKWKVLKTNNALEEIISKHKEAKKMQQTVSQSLKASFMEQLKKSIDENKFDKVQFARSQEQKNINRKIYKYNNRQEVTQQMIRQIQEQEKEANDLLNTNKQIFKGKYVQQLIQKKDQPDIVENLVKPCDGFSGKKVYKYQQYNKLIQLQNEGRKKFDPEVIFLGKKKNGQKKYKVQMQYSSSDEN